MGGSAFNAILAATSFPRISPPVYRALKTRLVPRLQELYGLVAVPIEAPEKKDHGDLDLLVCEPKSQYGTYVPHDVVKRTLHADYVVPMDGNRTSNYAVPIQRGEWDPLGYAADEAQKRELANNGEIYYQVDVHVCLDKAEWDRILFFHSYGDLGMILGVISRNNGLLWGEKGMKIPNPPNPPFELSDSFHAITKFYELPLEPFYEGFQTKQEAFDWAASMKYFDSSKFTSTGPGFTKVKPERKMYAEFVEWVKATKPSSHPYNQLPRQERFDRIREDALRFFNKKKEYEDLAKLRAAKTRLNDLFSGTHVRNWTGLGGHWIGVKKIMDEVRNRLGGEEGVLKFLEGHTEDDLKAVVLEVQLDLGMASSPTTHLQSSDDSLEKPSIDNEEDVTKDTNVSSRL
ncbi:hypothetical protein JR316_0007217 [Psilocybe cubensis]|uniref:Uncharacterized protein n=2 Tax=Psilocybe cubensis TaxID=181762 RepID=A0A8H7XTK1_PSICU|nr:hypothetical protein JR316_0007217 [Psilocybe cubensis]KAH9480617.1 hypothetical protein JR316_0007217 [Psilocybe cubensis]